MREHSEFKELEEVFRILWTYSYAYEITNIPNTTSLDVSDSARFWPHLAILM